MLWHWTYDSGHRERWDRAAAEYDKATSQLPEDVEAFLGECLVTIPDTTDHAERLIALVRTQGARIADLEATIKQMEEDEHDRRMEAREEYD